MKPITRRGFNTLLTLGAASMAMPSWVLGQGRPKVVIIGGGAGGATVAHYLAKDGAGAVDVTLVQQSTQYTTCFFSNLYLGDFRKLDSITHGYDKLSAMEGLTVVNDTAVAIDRDAKTVSLAGGSSLPYDRVVVAPGIDLIWDSVPGYSEKDARIAPHAWQAGPQTQILKKKLDALENGQRIVMVAPPNPYRCPPGPYERVSMMAHVLKSKGFTDCRITIIDTKPKFSKQALFMQGWEQHYPEMVEWLPPDIHGGILNVDAKAGTVETDLDTFQGDLLNIIPAQRAGAIAAAAGLTNDTGFCPVIAESMRSTMDDSVFVIGDASIAGAMPKSGFAANSQAKVAASNILGDLIDSTVYPASYSNTCWSLISPDNAVKVGAQYAASDEGKIESTTSFLSKLDESAEVRADTYRESVGWYDSAVKDMFGS